MKVKLNIKQSKNKVKYLIKNVHHTSILFNDEIQRYGRINGLEVEEVIFCLLDGLIDQSDNIKDTITNSILKFASIQPEFTLKSILSFLEVQNTSVVHQHSLLCIMKKCISQCQSTLPNTIIREVLVFMLKELNFIKASDSRHVEMKEIVNITAVLCPTFSVDLILAFINDVRNRSGDYKDVLAVYIKILTHLCAIVPKNSYIRIMLISSNLMGLYERGLFMDDSNELGKDLCTLLYTLTNMLMKNEYTTSACKFNQFIDLNYNSLYNCLDLEDVSLRRFNEYYRKFTDFKSIRLKRSEEDINDASTTNQMLQISNNDTRRSSLQLLPFPRNDLFGINRPSSIISSFYSSRGYQVDVNTLMDDSGSNSPLDNYGEIIEPLFELMINRYLLDIYTNPSYNFACMEILCSLVILSQYIPDKMHLKYSVLLLDAIIVRCYNYLPNSKYKYLQIDGYPNTWIKLHRTSSATFTSKIVTIFSSIGYSSDKSVMLPPTFFIRCLRLYIQFISCKYPFILYSQMNNTCEVLFGLLHKLFECRNELFDDLKCKNVLEENVLLFSNDLSDSFMNSSNNDECRIFIQHITISFRILYSNINTSLILLEYLYNKLASDIESEVMVSLYILTWIYSIKPLLYTLDYYNKDYNSIIFRGNCSRYIRLIHEICLLLDNFNNNFIIIRLILLLTNNLCKGDWLIFYYMKDKKLRVMSKLLLYIINLKVNYDIKQRIINNSRLNINNTFLSIMYQSTNSTIHDMTFTSLNTTFDSYLQYYSSEILLSSLMNLIDYKKNVLTIFKSLDYIITMDNIHLILNFTSKDLLYKLFIYILIYIHDPLNYFGEAYYSCRLLPKLVWILFNLEINIKLDIHSNLDLYLLDEDYKHVDEFNNDIIIHFRSISQVISNVICNVDDAMIIMKMMLPIIHNIKSINTSTSSYNTFIKMNDTCSPSFTLYHTMGIVNIIACFTKFSLNMAIELMNLLLGIPKSGKIEVKESEFDRILDVYDINFLLLINDAMNFTMTTLKDVRRKEGEVNRRADGRMTSGGMMSSTGPRVEPVADLWEAEGEVIKRADGRNLTSGLNCLQEGGITSDENRHFVKNIMKSRNNFKCTFNDKSSLQDEHVLLSGLILSRIILNSPHHQVLLLKFYNTFLMNIPKVSSFNIFGKSSVVLQSEKIKCNYISTISHLYKKISSNDYGGKSFDFTEVTYTRDLIKILSDDISDEMYAIEHLDPNKLEVYHNLKEDGHLSESKMKDKGSSELKMEDGSLYESKMKDKGSSESEVHVTSSESKEDRTSSESKVEVKDGKSSTTSPPPSSFSPRVISFKRLVIVPLLYLMNTEGDVSIQLYILNSISTILSDNDDENLVYFILFTPKLLYFLSNPTLKEYGTKCSYSIDKIDDYYSKLFNKEGVIDVLDDFINIKEGTSNVMSNVSFIILYKLSLIYGKEIINTMYPFSILYCLLSYSDYINDYSITLDYIDNLLDINLNWLIMYRIFMIILYTSDGIGKGLRGDCKRLILSLDILDGIEFNGKNINWLYIIILLWSHLLKLDFNNKLKTRLMRLILRLLDIKVDNYLNYTNKIDQYIPKEYLIPCLLSCINLLESSSYISDSLGKIIHKILQKRYNEIDINHLQSTLDVIFKRFGNLLLMDTPPIFLRLTLIDLTRANFNILCNNLFTSEHNINFQLSIVKIIINDLYILEEMMIFLTNLLKAQFNGDFRYRLNCPMEFILKYTKFVFYNKRFLINTEIGCDYIISLILLISSRGGGSIIPVADLREAEGEVNREGATPSGKTSGGEAVCKMTSVEGKVVLEGGVDDHYNLILLDINNCIYNQYIDEDGIRGIDNSDEVVMKGNTVCGRDTIQNLLISIISSSIMYKTSFIRQLNFNNLNILKLFINLIKLNLFKDCKFILLEIIKKLSKIEHLKYYYTKSLHYYLKYNKININIKYLLKKLINLLFTNDIFIIYHTLRCITFIISKISTNKLHKSIYRLLTFNFIPNERIKFAYLQLYIIICKWLVKVYKNPSLIPIQIKQYLIYPLAVAYASESSFNNGVKNIYKRAIEVIIPFLQDYTPTGDDICSSIESILISGYSNKYRCICGCNFIGRRRYEVYPSRSGGYEVSSVEGGGGYEVSSVEGRTSLEGRSLIEEGEQSSVEGGDFHSGTTFPPGTTFPSDKDTSNPPLRKGCTSYPPPPSGILCISRAYELLVLFSSLLPSSKIDNPTVPNEISSEYKRIKKNELDKRSRTTLFGDDLSSPSNELQHVINDDLNITLDENEGYINNVSCINISNNILEILNIIDYCKKDNVITRINLLYKNDDGIDMINISNNTIKFYNIKNINEIINSTLFTSPLLYRFALYYKYNKILPFKLNININNNIYNNIIKLSCIIINITSIYLYNENYINNLSNNSYINAVRLNCILHLEAIIIYISKQFCKLITNNSISLSSSIKSNILEAMEFYASIKSNTQFK